MLAGKYRPKTLAEVVGQPQVAQLRAFARQPFPACWLLVGPPGTGKTSAAYAMASDLGVAEWDIIEVAASDLTIERVRELQRRWWLRPMNGRWRVLLIEELDALPSAAVVRALKVALEDDRLPGHLVVIATSNDIEGLNSALLERFRVLHFYGTNGFARAAADRLRWVWGVETEGRPCPLDLERLGQVEDRYSLRVALRAMETYLGGKERVTA